MRKKSPTPEARAFDLEAVKLPASITKNAMASGGFPYAKKLPSKTYARDLKALQHELVKAQDWMRESGARIVVLFEGRDSAGKGGTIKILSSYLNPRWVRIVALDKPTDRERGEWYFQRYVQKLPSHGEMILFDRSWYNRAGVEPVMGFCTPEQHEAFLEAAPRFEQMLVDDGFHLIKIWLNIGQEMQIKRFHDRRHDPLRRWKFSPMDVAALDKWDDYTRARDRMFEATHRPSAPWTVIRANDKRRARLHAIRRILRDLPYPDKNVELVADVDPEILGTPELLA